MSSKICSFQCTTTRTCKDHFKTQSSGSRGPQCVSELAQYKDQRDVVVVPGEVGVAKEPEKARVEGGRHTTERKGQGSEYSRYSQWLGPGRQSNRQAAFHMETVSWHQEDRLGCRRPHVFIFPHLFPRDCSEKLLSLAHWPTGPGARFPSWSQPHQRKRTTYGSCGKPWALEHGCL